MDVDIDVKPNFNKNRYGVRASIYNESEQTLQAHPSGVYIDSAMPIDLISGIAAIPYEQAEELGFMKIDLLSNTVYDNFQSKIDVLNALNKEPDWLLFQNEKVVKTLPHIAGHFDLIQILKPKSIEDLADVLALIRPGKTHLIDKYIKDKQSTRENLYRKPKIGMYFKKSHAIAYACMIVCVLNKQELVSFR